MQKDPQGGLAEVLDLILDKGLVIDAFVKVSLVGIEILTIDARIVVASVDTYLRFAEATNRLDLHAKGGKDLGEVVGGMTEGATQGGAKGKTKGVLDAGKEKWDEVRGERQSRREQA
ncbi:gas vesicle protein GvpA/GvpJ/GvpM family [Actinomycetospora succinea]|uniref:Gas vesicle protein A n=1 Tax=Actinomycetospora succinea TaxID=663603 RepID=A0A4R6VE49_9PSEU|nr:gas vesicle protein GvpA/GvpJ/GvpM family [Actinomycetospora succinea]